MQGHFDGWQKASHHAVAVCNDCHVPHEFPDKWFVKAENGYHHSVAFTFENFHEPIRMRPESYRLLNQNCIECHQGMVEMMVAYAGYEAEFDCVRCHRDVGHGPTK
jgi:cytochrome c nitrite reductase small subunit